MDLASPSPRPDSDETGINSLMPTTKKISQDTDSQSFVDSGIACERSDSTIGNEVGDEGSRRERRTQRYSTYQMDYKLCSKVITS